MRTFLATCLVIITIVTMVQAESHLVQNGKPQAEIIIAEQAPRTTWLAAQDLQTYLQKISGAKLEIVTEPTGNVPNRVYVGRSKQTDALQIATDDLMSGAYRMQSGDNWLVLIGDDTNFTPIEPWPRSNNDIRSGKLQAGWNKITGKQWGYPHSQLHKHYNGPNSLFGTPQEQQFDKDGRVHVWTYDERGSFNAVCGFLRELGVRWYMPGEIGEVVPQQKTIAIPNVDKTVTPDFPMRILNFRTAVYGRDVAMWGFRLGVRQPYGRQAAHGLHNMTHNEQTLKNHPEWFALYGGKRHTQLGQRLNQLCYSNEDLFSETVQFVRAQFDHFKMDVVSVMPPDGYTAICQCDLCEGKASPELGARGFLSNYVWDYVNRVAKEVAKTHPDKRISCCAYGVYTNPPSNIDKLEPNVQVIIVGGRRPTQADRKALKQLRAGWAKKTDNPLEIFENYPFTARGWYLPAYFTQTLGDSINATKGISRGEDIWLSMHFGEDAIGFNHFLIYFTARMYWGGKQQDIGKMFDEYCRLFYGRSAKPLLAFFQYCEANWRDMEHDAAKANRALELFAIAKSQAPANSIYARRIQLIDNYLNGLRNKSVQLAQKWGPVPKLRLVSGSRGEIVIDGKLDDEPWVKCPTASTGSLRELQTGRIPTFGTKIKTEWIGSNLYFAIRCEERKGDRPNIATTQHEDQAIWYGDVIELLLDTDSHSYYQIAFNPAGALIDLDRGAPRSNWFRWDSKAEVATQIADGYWTAEIRIPITEDENDPLHQVIGHKPTQSLPWHINICRQRTREKGTELSAFSPTGTKGFHKKLKFAHFYAGRSHTFSADASVTDYLIASRKADDLSRKRQHKQALNAWLSLSLDKSLSDFQKSDALQKTALCYCQLKDYQLAEELVGQIPHDAVAKTTRMQILAAQREWKEIVTRFALEDFTKWPFWQIGAGAALRGKAYYFTKSGQQAEADLKLALDYEPDTRTQVGIRATLAQNRETNLKDAAGALPLYLKNIEGKSAIGAAEDFRSLQNAARILVGQGKHQAALKLFDKVDFDQQTGGHWLHEMLISKGQTLSAAGQKDAARELYRKVLADDSASAAHRKRAEKILANE